VYGILILGVRDLQNITFYLFLTLIVMLIGLKILYNRFYKTFVTKVEGHLAIININKYLLLGKEWSYERENLTCMNVPSNTLQVVNSERDKIVVK